MRSSLFDLPDEPAPQPAQVLPELNAISTLMYFEGAQGLGWYARGRRSNVFHYHPSDPLEACRKTMEKRSIRKRLL